MTVIVWDGKVLASDRMAHVGGTPLPPTRKIHRLCAPNEKVALIGFAGSQAFANSYLHWMFGGEEPLLKQGEDMRWAIILIEAPGLVWHRSDTANRWDLFGKTCWAIGSGADYALGAMAQGASALEAVKIASQLDNQCGFGVDMVCF